MRKVVAGLAVVVALGGCASNRGASARPSAGDDVRRKAAAAVPVPADPDSARDHFVRHGLRPMGTTRAAIVAALGAPERVEREPVVNRHVPTQTDTVVTLHYAGLAATVYHVSGGRDILAAVLVRDDRHLAAPIVRIGMPWAEVRRRLGEPQERLDGAYGYDCESCMGPGRPVYIHVRGGIVTAVEFTYYVD